MDVREQALEWLELDPDPETRAELQRLLESDDETELRERFDGRLEFGTAGLRGALGAGPTRMNRVVVRQTTAGLAARLAEEGPVGETIVLVGRDARHKSDVFARDVVAVLADAGFDVRFFGEPVPTPLLAYAVGLLGAGAGVQITASHNPAPDNGYKVYWRGGAQIVPPVDAQIAAAIAAAATPVELSDEEVGRALPDDLVDAYTAAVLRLAVHPEHRQLAIVYTPLHGVGGRLAVALLQRAGFEQVSVVEEQFVPDPDFPTVTFPNPEEPGALDLALEQARRSDAELVIANDPDADRVAVAVRDGERWRVLTGDELGCLLADYLLAELPGGSERMVATTVVSSQLLARIAADHSVGFAVTLTGLKWLAQAAAQAEAEGRRMVLAYEEALGVMIGDAVRDKDGLSAALLLADCAATLHARGQSVPDRLDALALRHGVHLTAQRSIRYDASEGLADRVLQQLRDEPPAQVAGVDVRALVDYEPGVRRLADGATEPVGVPATPLIALELVDGSRLQVRPSGTEPKLKCYLEAVEPVGAGGDVRAAREAAERRLATQTAAFLELTGLSDR